jgi:uncharacterized protein
MPSRAYRQSYLALTLLWPLYLPAASFDCSSNRLNASEHLICDNSDLSKLDSDLAAAYTAARERSSPEDRATLLKEQRAWIVQKSKCSEISCLADSYMARVDQLRSTTSTSAQAGGVTSAAPPAAGLAAPTTAHDPPPAYSMNVDVKFDDADHRWIKVDEREVSGNYLTARTYTEVDAMSISHETSDKRVVLVRNTMSIAARSYKTVSYLHEAIGCGEQVFVVRDITATLVTESQPPKTIRANGKGDVNHVEFDSIDSKVLDYACAH